MAAAVGIGFIFLLLFCFVLFRFIKYYLLCLKDFAPLSWL